MKSKIFVFFYIIFASITILTTVSYGYLDPSAMTYVIQIIAAIVIAIPTAIGVMIYKIKNAFAKKEKNKKEQDSEKKANVYDEIKKEFNIED